MRFIPWESDRVSHTYSTPVKLPAKALLLHEYLHFEGRKVTNKNAFDCGGYTEWRELAVRLMITCPVANSSS